MPRPAYIFLKGVLILCDSMLAAACFLHMNGNQPHLALLLTESPAGILLLASIALAFLLDRCQ